LVGIASGSGLSARHVANRYGFHYATGDESQVVNDPNINTIAILTRHNLHASQVLAGLRAGKHIFCEKPLALNQSELDEIFTLLAGQQASCPLLTVGFNRRYALLANKLKDFIDQRKEPLVAHYRINAGYLPLDHWLHDPNQGGGRIIGEGCHFIDFLTFLVGEAPISVSGVALPDAGYYRQDNLALTFTFRDGSLGTIHYLANGDKSFPKERLEVFAGGRVAVLNDFRTLELVHAGHRGVLRSRLRQDKGHLAEWESFLNAIRTTGSPPIRYTDLYSVSQASFAAVKALQTGQSITIQMVPR
jgi:predicted dehydrogenase